MRGSFFHRPTPRHFSVVSLCSLCLCGAFVAAARTAVAQEEAIVEQLAPLIAAEDARDFSPDLFARGLVAPDSFVRRIAALGAGRIGDLRATPLIVPLLADPDSTVRVSAAFALGLLRDSAAAQPIIDRLTGLPALEPATAVEAVTALAKIGGPAVGGFFAGVLGGKVVLSQDDRELGIREIVLQSWRLGPDAPVANLLPFMDDTNAAVRWRAVFALGRLRAPAAAARMLLALRDEDVYIRSLAARALSRGYAQAARLSPATVADVLARLASDPNIQVRISALGALGSYHDSTLSVRIVPQLNDQVPNVQVAAAEAMGNLGGSEAVKGLARLAGARGLFAVRRAALVALAQVDTAAFAAAASAWRKSTDWRERVAVAEGTAAHAPGSNPWFLTDRDGRVIAAGLQAWSTADTSADPGILRAARRLLNHADAGVRSVAADIVTRVADPADLPALAAMYARTGRDSFPDAALSALKGILAIRKSGPGAQARVDREFLQTTSRPADYLVRRWAEENWPEAEAKWGPAYPIATGRTTQEYRDLVRRFITRTDSLARPRITIETEQRGPVVIELLGPDAPLTVANFLRLVDRHFFDGNRWHRVVPNFVVQDGDPRGDGFGGPGGAIRDEVNMNRYDGPMLGMALSGPDTGASQWFITLSAQPHLDGTYTIFGRVVSGIASLLRITQGDQIRTIHR
jgi:cyclophilin family peptidyl-prolyl cis-trans isomerase/HEAT repeat protein